MKKQRKKYSKPFKPWNEERLQEEREIMRIYGLRRKKELWRSEAIIRKFRRIAREAVANRDENMKKIVLEKLYRMGILDKNADINDVLNLTVRDILERRLQTLVYKKGFANTINQARQLIVHRKVSINGRKVPFPSHLVNREEESLISIDEEILKKINAPILQNRQ